MTAISTISRRAPVRGLGRIAVQDLRRRAARGLVVTDYGGGQILVDPTNPPEVAAYVWGVYEPDVEAVIRAALHSRSVVVDVGANCGVLTVAMAATARGGHVIALDPSPNACRRVHEQAILNGFEHVTIENVAVGQSTSTATFAAGRVGIGALPAEDIDLTMGDGIGVDVRSLDDVLQRVGVGRFDLVKIDTDGNEADVLRGACEALRRHRPVLVLEVFPEGLRRRGSSPEELGQIVVDLGYDLFSPVFTANAWWRTGPPTLRHFALLEATAACAGELPHGNVVALHRSERRHEDVRRRLS